MQTQTFWKALKQELPLNNTERKVINIFLTAALVLLAGLTIAAGAVLMQIATELGVQPATIIGYWLGTVIIAGLFGWGAACCFGWLARNWKRE